MDFHFSSRRSPVYATRGMVATSATTATAAGLEILRQGGTAADAAVAAAAALNVVEPTSTGIGGDCFALYFDARTGAVSALNGSGRAPRGLDAALIERQGLREGDQIRDPYHAHCVTVPGAAAGWLDALSKHGRMTAREVLAPAIRMAEEGAPIGPVTAFFWARAAERQLRGRGEAMLIEGRAPRAGERFRNPGLARTFRALAEGGKAAFYTGEIAARIVAAVQGFGGVMTPADLAAHASTFEAPISTTYRGHRIWECPPNGQGLAALLTLNVLEGFAPGTADGPDVDEAHRMIEALRLAFLDTRWFVADPASNPAPLAGLLGKAYADQRRKLIHPTRATLDQRRGAPVAGSDTVYLCVVDGEGNACSFINSNYMGFGTGIVPEGCGFTLQNRGHNFTLESGHPNALAPGKRPYHTIIPGLITRPDGSLYGPFGVMGGFMQPQGHAQVAINLIDRGLDPQAALDRPRLCLEPATPDGRVAVEAGFDPALVAALRTRGHDAHGVEGAARSLFGRGQIIRRDADGVLCGGSDPRADGCAMGF
ncbi:MAG: gamma-glutamyltransferase family protein [Thermoflexales bacterium]|nr:gamma-glutamyltransferase family protein [Thermoflexales bacterium]